MDSYFTSEQLFLDIWEEYGCPSDIYDKSTINEILQKIVERSETYIVLDHYSGINFDYISKIGVIDRYTLLHWFDNNEYRKEYLSKTPEDELNMLIWQTHGYATYSYILLDISKIKFFKIDNHLFLLLESNLIPQREISKIFSRNYTVISAQEHTSELYTEYSFFEGDQKELIKHICFVGNLPYYACVIQPKENIPDVGISRSLLLEATVVQVNDRISKVRAKLSKIDERDTDELRSVGNTIRIILEYILKYYCVICEIDIGKMKIEQKYGYIVLGDLAKMINAEGKIFIDSETIIITNELSHDSGIIVRKNDLGILCKKANEIVNSIRKVIAK